MATKSYVKGFLRQKPVKRKIAGGWKLTTGAMVISVKDHWRDKPKPKKK